MTSAVDMTMMSGASVGDLTKVDGVTVPILEANRSQNLESEEIGTKSYATVESQKEVNERQNGVDTSSKASQLGESIHDDDRESIISVSGSVTESLVAEAGDDSEEGNENDEADQDVTVASICGSMDVRDKDNEVEDIQFEHETIDASALPRGPARGPARQTGKRTHRDETQSEEHRMEQEAAKQKPKRTRCGLCELSERRCPSYLNDYVANVVQVPRVFLTRAEDLYGQAT